MKNVRIERMLRELHAGPPLRFFEDLFALRDIVAGMVGEMRASRAAEAPQVEIGAPILAGVAGGASPR
ncbi:MAG TPA: hypothetical protein VF038_16250 [Usitatibacter sp.]